jgi:hypothetical protein
LIHPNRNYSPRLLTPVINDGYGYITFTFQGQRISRRGIHAVVLEAFVGPRPKGKYACHKDGDKSRNWLSNLYWGTPVENQTDRVLHGNGQGGEENGSAKLTKRQALKILIIDQETGLSCYKIAAMFKVCGQTICDIRNFKSQYVSRREFENLSPGLRQELYRELGYQQL